MKRKQNGAAVQAVSEQGPMRKDSPAYVLWCKIARQMVRRMQAETPGREEKMPGTYRK